MNTIVINDAGTFLPNNEVSADCLFVYVSADEVKVFVMARFP